MTILFSDEAIRDMWDIKCFGLTSTLPHMLIVVVGFLYNEISQMKDERGRLLRVQSSSRVHDSNNSFLFYVEYMYYEKIYKILMMWLLQQQMPRMDISW